MVYATTEELLRTTPAKTGVPHLRAMRPGLSKAFYLSISAGGLRPDCDANGKKTPTVLPEVSARWNLKLTARLIVSLFCGLVERVSYFLIVAFNYSLYFVVFIFLIFNILTNTSKIPAADAAASGITADAYNEAIADHEDVSKFYKVTHGPDGTPQRTRRFDVHCKTLIGTHRPIYRVDAAGKKILHFYER
jgi:hypothetical protein